MINRWKFTRTESFNLFLYLFLSEVESRQENVRKNLRTKINRSKIKQKINTELALYPLLHVLTEKKRHHQTCRPHLHPVSETFCFWQITEKKEKKSTLVYVHEQMNSWRKKKKKNILMVPLFYTWLSLENKMKTAVVITLFFSSFHLVRAHFFHATHLHIPTFSTIPFLSRGYPVFLCARGTPLKISLPKAPPQRLLSCALM